MARTIREREIYWSSYLKMSTIVDRNPRKLAGVCMSMSVRIMLIAVNYIYNFNNAGLDPFLAAKIQVGGERMLAKIRGKIKGGKRFASLTIISLEEQYDIPKFSKNFRFGREGLELALDPECFAHACNSISESAPCLILGSVTL